MQLNPHYAELNESYLFSTIAHKVADYQKAHPEADVIRLGIGDVTLPLAASVTEAMHKAVEEQGRKETFHGYIPSEQGYVFLREAILKYYAKTGVSLDMAEIFISDGAKSDLGNLLDLFSQDNTILVPDPVYPVYVDDNVMAGRKILYLPATAGNNFLPMPDEAPHADIVYICSPNNPTGATYSVEQLKAWVDGAKQNDAVILFDAAYEAFVGDKSLPRSIFEIDGARTCAIEFCSLSKTAGFTGTRCGYTVVPFDLESDGVKLNKMWLRRQTTKFNGVPYIVQKGAAAVFSDEGQKQIHQVIGYYKQNAKVIADALKELGVWFTGGEHSPYFWLQCPNGMASWDFFDLLLKEGNVVGTPGAGFGKNGEGFFRLTAFNDLENTRKAVERIKKVLSSL